MSALMKSNNFLIIKVTFRKRRSTRSQARKALRLAVHFCSKFRCAFRERRHCHVTYMKRYTVGENVRGSWLAR